MKKYLMGLLLCSLAGLVIAQSNARIESVNAVSVHTITLPFDRAIYQRINNQASIRLAGQLRTIRLIDQVQYKVEKLDKYGNVMGIQTDWTSLPLTTIVLSGGLFNATLNNIPTGWYDVQVRTHSYALNTYEYSNPVKFGVGEVLFFAGQSNAQAVPLADQGGAPVLSGTPYDCISAVNQDCWCRITYQFPKYTVLQRSGSDGTQMIAPNNNLNVWCYEALGRKLIDEEEQGGKVVPIAFFNAAYGGVAITPWKESIESPTRTDIETTFGKYVCDPTFWSSDGSEGHPYRGLKTSLNYYGGMLGARGVVWHQGEGDTKAGTNSATYATALKKVIEQTRSDFNSGLGWAISRVSRFGEKNNQNIWTEYTSSNVISGQQSIMDNNLIGNKTWGAYYSDNILDRINSNDDKYTHFNQTGLVKLADLYATGTFSGNSGTPMGGDLFSVNPVGAQLAPSLSATFNADYSQVTLSVEGSSNNSSFCWVTGLGKMNECQATSQSITRNNSGNDTDWRCYVTSPTGQTTISQTANLPIPKVTIFDKLFLVLANTIGGTGSFKVNSDRIDWTVTNVPSWVTLNTSQGSDGQTQVNVTFQANSGAARSATLVVSGVENASRQEVVISQQGTGGGSCDFNITAGSSNSGPGCGAGITLTANCSGNDCGSVGYSWSGNGLSGSSNPINTNAPSSNGTVTYTVTASKSGCDNKTASTNVTVSGCSGPSSNCSAESVECSGNQYEVRNYTVSASGSGTYTIKAHYTSHEGSGVIRWSINGGSVQTTNVSQTGVNQYVEVTLGTASLSSGNNTVNLSTGGSYLCFKKACIEGGGTGGSCNFSVTAASNNSSPGCGAGITLTANCSGGDCGSVGYSWSGNGLSGSSNPINTNAPSSNGTVTYTVTASKSGCGSQTASTNVTVSGCSGPSSNCSAESIECSGNQYEVRNYTVSASGSGTYTIKAHYTSHEGSGVIRWSINGGSVQTTNVSQTGVNQYAEVTLGTASLNSGNNTVNLSTGGSYLCFKKACIEGGGTGGSCNFSVTAASNNSSPGCGAGITLTANCSGGDCGSVGYSWSGNGLSGSSNPINTNAPSSNGTVTYTVTASKSGCGSQTASTNVTVSGCSGPSSNCSAESIECSGNQYEVRNYTVSASGSGTYTIKAHYTSHEGSGVIRWSINGGGVQTTNVSQTGVNQYAEVTLGTASLNSGNNTVNLSSGQAFICFKKACIQSGARIGEVNNEETISVSEEKTIQLYPNPTNGKITLRYYLDKGKKATVQFMNLSGSVLARKSLVGAGGWQEDQTDLSTQPNGSYLLLFEADKRIITRKFIIVK